MDFKWFRLFLRQSSSIFLFVSCILQQSPAASCKFEGLIASCHKDIAGIPLQISARINHCHSPLDISFLIKSPRHYPLGDRSEPLYWEYTYVTTNKQESREIPGFDTRIFFLLEADEKPLVNESKRETLLGIQAHFKIEDSNTTTTNLIRQNVTIYRFDDCLYAERDSHIAKIAIGMSVSVVVFVVSVLGAYLFVRNRRLRSQIQDEEKQDLVKNMAPQSRRKRKTKKSNVKSSSDSIKYVVPTEGSKEETHELEIYVSTTTGLEKVQFPSKNNSTECDKSTSIQSDEKPS